MNKIVLFILLLLLFSSCTRSNRLRLKVGNCVQEYNKQYASFADSSGDIFKITGMDSRQLKLKRWYNGGWYYLKDRPISYFDESKNFSYEFVSCPDAKTEERKSIKDTVKAIEI